MNAQQNKVKSKKVKALFLAYHKEVLARLSDLVSKAGIDNLIHISTADLAKREIVKCEMVIAVLGREENLQSFKQDIAFLKVVRKIPVVIAMVEEKAQEALSKKNIDNTASYDVFVEGDRRQTKTNSKNNSSNNNEYSMSDVTADEVLYLPIAPKAFEKAIKTHIVSIKIEQNKNLLGLDLTSRPKPLGEILVEGNLISSLQLKKALELQRSEGLRLGDTLVRLGYIDDEQKTTFLARQLGVPIATSKQFASADTNIVALIPEHIARQYDCIALEKKNNILVVAMEDVLDLRLLDNLRDITELTIKPVLATRKIIKSSLERFYSDIASQQKASTLLDDLGDIEVIQSEEESIDIEKAAAEGAELGIIKLVNMIIANAIRDRASDIHIEPMEKELLVRYRIDGDLRKAMSPPKLSHQAIITRIKILSNLDIAERRLPQDGRTAVKIGKKEIDIRVSILPSVFGEKVVMRILDKDAFQKSTSNLGFTSRNLAIFKTQIAKPYGMIIVTGPTGSGKSTTLYSALQTIKNVTKNIITVEDPVEFHIEGVTQVQVNAKIGMTFSAALRSILRQDPDIILIGEIRDAETADTAIKMALTGHLVFSTLHTNDASSSIARFVDIGVPPLLLGASLNLIVAQRLVRRICPECKKEYSPTAELLEKLNMEPKESIKFYKGEGCVACNGTGFTGRTGLFEMLPITKDLRTLIIRNAPTPEIQAQAEKDGMETLRQAGIKLALKGETTIEQVIAATTEI